MKDFLDRHLPWRRDQIEHRIAREQTDQDGASLGERIARLQEKEARLYRNAARRTNRPALYELADMTEAEAERSRVLGIGLEQEEYDALIADLETSEGERN